MDWDNIGCITLKKLRSGNYETVDYELDIDDKGGVMLCSEKEIKDWWKNKPNYAKVIRIKYSKSWELYKDADDMIKWFNKSCF